MLHITRIRLTRQITRFRESFLQFTHLPFDDLFPIENLATIVENTPSKRGSVFTPLVTLKAFIFQVFSGNPCKKVVAGVLADRLREGKTANTINTGPYCKARQRLPLKPLEEAASNIGSRLHSAVPETWRWKDHNVVLTDGTTVLMPDTPDNQVVFPQQSNQKPGLGFPIARMVALISLAAGTMMGYSVGAYQGKGTGETSLLSQLLGHLQVGDLLMADRYYCTFAIIALLQARGIPVLFQMHANKKADFSQGISLGAKDHLIDWKKPPRKPVWMSEIDYAALPETLTVRELSVKGMVYVTTLLDNKAFHKQELASLYQERWKIELDLRSIKTHMGMEMLRCKSPDMVKKEIAIHFMAYNFIRWSLAQAAILNKKIPREISFKSAVQIITEASKQLGNLVGNPLLSALHALLKAMTTTLIGKQKRKNQPRAIKRRPKPFPLLTVPRYEACLSL